MPAARNHVKTIFGQVAEIESSDERIRYLDEACSGDSALRAEVEDLLAAMGNAGDFLVSRRPVDATVDLLPPERPGTTIGPYKLRELLGEGGMGTVYVAEQEQPIRRKVALKIIKPGMDSRDVLGRFNAERQTLALMDHPNIAKALDAGTTESGRPYFVMELVRGIPITEFCDQRKLSTRERLELFIEVCRAIQHAHQKGIIHRDIKPTNVLVTMHDDQAVPKVIDFGIAKATSQRLTEQTIYTAFAQMVGTPLYMSPEQAEMNALDVDTRSDVYSLGVLLYELLTGHTPFDSETLRQAGFDEMRRLIREVDPPRPSQRISTLNAQAASTIAEIRRVDDRQLSRLLRGELDWIVMKSLEKDRARRYESASSLAADVQRYLAGELVQACPPSAAYRFRKFARKHQAGFSTAVIVAASLLLGITFSLWQAIRATAAEAQATTNEAKAKTEEQRATALAQSEATQRQRAEASEQQAKDRLFEVEQQRKQAERNFESAIEAVDRLLTHVSDPDLNDLPRVGPLRRKMLKDAIAFYERIPLKSAGSINARYRLAKTWDRIGRLSWDLDEHEQARASFNTAISGFNQLAAEEPGKAHFRISLAHSVGKAGLLSQWQFHDHGQAEILLRRSELLFAGLANDFPAEQKKWLLLQASDLKYLSQPLVDLGKREEAIGSLNRVLSILEQIGSESTLDYGSALHHLAQIYSSTPSKSDELFQRAIKLYRSHYKSGNATTQERINFGNILWASAVRTDYAHRQPDEAEQMLAESVSILRDVCGRFPERRVDALDLVRSLRAQANQLRRPLNKRDVDAHGDDASKRTARADALTQESLERQRQLVTRFAERVDQFDLVKFLANECNYVLATLQASKTQPIDAAETRLRADALLTESLQFCRALCAKSPDNAEYQTRLTALLKLQAEHFGQIPDGKPEETPKK